jgi:hypothetical protein
MEGSDSLGGFAKGALLKAISSLSKEDAVELTRLLTLNEDKREELHYQPQLSPVSK